MRRVIADLEAIDFQPLPDVVPLEWITEGRGLDNTLRPDRRASTGRSSSATRPGSTTSSSSTSATRPTSTSSASARRRSRGSPTSASRRWCRASRSTSSGPTTSCGRLAKLAVELDVADALASGGVDEALAAVAARPRGDEWMAAWEAAKDPWFNFSSGNGFYSTDKVWLDHLEIPLGYLRDYVAARAGRARTSTGPTAAIAAERDRITARVPRAARPTTRCGPRSTRSSGSRGWCSPTSRTTTSTSSTGRCRCSGARSAQLGAGARGRGLLAGRRRHLLRAPRRAPAGALRLRQRLGARAPSRSARSYWPAEIERRSAASSRAREQGAAAGDERAARGRHRAVHDHALRHHHRQREPLAVGLGRQR